jgi:hypothetical protein
MSVNAKSSTFFEAILGGHASPLSTLIQLFDSIISGDKQHHR